ncbi:hypothetical protein [Neobacillus sp. LXY-4]|uniref:hypothetical protein n=1 Tax=Neobacillus sp. LXY-4 TaxID=3379826 RepID=UPI003EE15473
MKKLKALSYGTGVLLSIIGLGGVTCGLMLMVQPDGASIGLPLDLLKGSPFEDFFIPGIALFTVNGVTSFVGALLSFQLHRFSGIVTTVLGIAMIIWILAEMYWYGGASFLQPAMFAVGVVEIVLGLMLNAQYLENPKFFKHHPGSHTH